MIKNVLLRFGLFQSLKTFIFRIETDEIIRIREHYDRHCSQKEALIVLLKDDKAQVKRAKEERFKRVHHLIGLTYPNKNEHAVALERFIRAEKTKACHQDVLEKMMIDIYLELAMAYATERNLDAAKTYLVRYLDQHHIISQNKSIIGIKKLKTLLIASLQIKALYQDHKNISTLLTDTTNNSIFEAQYLMILSNYHLINKQWRQLTECIL